MPHSIRILFSLTLFILPLWSLPKVIAPSGIGYSDSITPVPVYIPIFSTFLLFIVMPYGLPQILFILTFYP